MTFNNEPAIIDGREIIERIEELTAEWEQTTGDTFADYALSSDDYAVGLSEDDAEELAALIAFRDEIADYLPEWQYGETLIRDDYFTEYTRELLTDIGYIADDFPSWIVIDWDETADNVRQDYTSAELNGVTYWGRS